MNGSKNPDEPTDEMCQNCGLYFSRRGIIPHRRNCSRDEPLLPLDRHQDDVEPEGGEASSREEGEAPTPPDGVGDGAPPEAPDPPGDAPTPRDEEVSTDGGLGLGGAPELDVDDQDDGDGAACCDEPDRRALDEGTPIDLEDGTRVRADPGDELCQACGALVEADGSVRR